MFGNPETDDEKSSSNFLRGFIIAWCFGKLISSEPK